jgi:hypothetical protein
MPGSLDSAANITAGFGSSLQSLGLGNQCGEMVFLPLVACGAHRRLLQQTSRCMAADSEPAQVVGPGNLAERNMGHDIRIDIVVAVVVADGTPSAHVFRCRKTFLRIALPGAAFFYGTPVFSLNRSCRAIAERLPDSKGNRT